MERLLFNWKEYDRLYSCDVLTSSEWQSYRNPNIAVGSLYLITGMIYLMLYIPFIFAMTRKQFFKFSCYKLMFLLGILDIFGIVFSGIITGVMTIQGEIFCTNRDFNYVIGCLSTGIWVATCLTCIILAINRALDFIYPRLGVFLFEGRRCFAWYLPPLLWGFYFVMFRFPHVFSSRGLAFFFQPYFDIQNPKLKDLGARTWDHRIHSINNSIVVILLPLIYAVICVAFFIRTRKKTSTVAITNMQKLIFIQCFLLCALTVSAALVYVIINYISAPSMWLNAFGQIMWQSAHGAAVIIYLSLNQSLRRKTFPSIFPSQRLPSIFPGSGVSKRTNKKVPVLRISLYN